MSGIEQFLSSPAGMIATLFVGLILVLVIVLAALGRRDKIMSERLDDVEEALMKQMGSNRDQSDVQSQMCIRDRRYPDPSMAQQACMSTEAFEDYYFDVCCLDYGKMARAMEKLVSRMKRTDKVRIVGQGTDLSFSIKGMNVVPLSLIHI